MSCQVVGNRSREHRPPRRGARSGERQLLLEETNIGEFAGQFDCFKILLQKIGQILEHRNPYGAVQSIKSFFKTSVANLRKLTYMSAIVDFFFIDFYCSATLPILVKTWNILKTIVEQIDFNIFPPNYQL